jgi:hypothetical protein
VPATTPIIFLLCLTFGVAGTSLGEETDLDHYKAIGLRSSGSGRLEDYVD